MSCDPLIAAMKECLLKSDCVVKKKRLPSVCLREHTDELPDQCKFLRHSIYVCKRSQLDMRKRFRGKPTVGHMEENMDEVEAPKAKL